MTMVRNWCGATSSRLIAAALLLGAAGPLPQGTRIDPPAAPFPTQMLESELAGGRQGVLVALGNTAFSSPLLYGQVARDAGLSCNSCHTNGHVNHAFFVPGHSTRPGNFDATNGTFNPRADNGVLDPLDIPSLRGVRLTGPWGRDGRIGSLREFARHVIVDEFAGPEPAPLLLDALAAYMNEQAFLPNPRIDALGRLVTGATASETRGETLFARPFTGMAGMACASCHVPSALFTDGRVHDVGTGGRFKTPTLVNSSDSAPYFHDGRAESFAAVVGHFDQKFGLGLSAQDRDDLAAYLGAIGHAEEPEEPPSFGREMGELAIWVDLLDQTITDADRVLTRFVAETVAADLARLSRTWPEGDAARAGRRPDRTKTPVDFAALTAGILRVPAELDAGRPDAARAALTAYFDLAERMAADYPRRDRVR